MGEMLDYLPAEEETVGKHKVGGYDVVTTSERVIFLRKFPPAFTEVFIGDIVGLEHDRKVRWGELAAGAVLFAIAASVYLASGSGLLASQISLLVSQNTPGLAGVLPVDFVIMAAILVLATSGVYCLGIFLPTLRGQLKILRRGHATVAVSVPMDSALKKLMGEVEGLVKRKTSVVPVVSGETAENADSPEAIRAMLDPILDGAHRCDVILISSKSENHSMVVSSSLDILVNQRKMGGVYLSVTRPYEFILSMMEDAKTPSGDVYFIDCISLMAGKAQHGKDDNVVFVENPSSLEEVSMYVDRMLSKVKSPKKFLFVDSLSSLLIYNNEDNVKEFTHSIINKTRLDNIAGVILSIDKREADDLLKTLSPMCDREVRF
jgi:hypothetical protein